jgi:hypothetical protein
MGEFSLVWRIAEPIIGGVLLNIILRMIERRPRVVVYYGHVGEFHVQPTQHNTAFGVHTHSVVVRNAGRLSARNVRVPHRLSLAAATVNVSVYPDTPFSRSMMPGGGEEFLFPALVPGQEVTISYLYYPPLTFNQINLPISSDEGMARVLTVMPRPLPPKWLLRILWALVIAGGISVITALVLLGEWIATKVA